MDLIWKKIVFVLIYSPLFISGLSREDLYIDLIQRNLSDFGAFKKFYQDFLRDIRQHRIIDTVSSPINLEKIQSNDYDEDYLKNSVRFFSITFQRIISSFSAIKLLLICSMLMDTINRI